jgi:hypothetical protein
MLCWHRPDQLAARVASQGLTSDFGPIRSEVETEFVFLPEEEQTFRKWHCTAWAAFYDLQGTRAKTPQNHILTTSVLSNG